MKIIDSFKKFHKIVRKYFKRHCVKRVDYLSTGRCVSYWEKEDWIGFAITKPEQLEDIGIIKSIENHIDPNPMVCAEFIHDFRKKYLKEPYQLFDEGGVVYSLRGLILTNRDVYYLVEKDEQQYLRPIYNYKEKHKIQKV